MKCASRAGWPGSFRRASGRSGERDLGCLCRQRNDFAFRDGTNGPICLLLAVVVDGSADVTQGSVGRQNWLGRLGPGTARNRSVIHDIRAETAF